MDEKMPQVTLEFDTPTLTLEPEQQENLFVILTAPNHPARPAVIYSELKVAGRELENGDFSQGLQLWGRGNTERGELIRLPGDPRQYLTDGRQFVHDIVAHKIKCVLGSEGKI